MKKRLICILNLLSILSLISGMCFAEKTVSERFLEELEAYRMISDVPTAFESRSWKNYNTAGKALRNMDPENMTEKDIGKLEKVEKAHEALVQNAQIEDCIWMIWGEAMPVSNPSGLSFSHATVDGEDFRPFLVPYLAEDQGNVKGNIIIVAGGGYSRRSNDGEGYPVAEEFLSRGYNCYVLQRRVFPYQKEDIWMDMQRAVRYLRYYAEEKGLGGSDRIIGMGFSGGSGTVLGAVQFCYGNTRLDQYDSSYIPDSVDAVSSDMDAVCAIYGPNVLMQSEYQGFETENEHLPEMFIAVGQLDNTGAAPDCLKLVASVLEKTKVEIHLFADARHGFALGIGENNSAYWVPMADDFLGRVGKQ